MGGVVIAGHYTEKFMNIYDITNIAETAQKNRNTKREGREVMPSRFLFGVNL